MTNMKPPQEGRNTGAPSLRGLQGRSATGLNGQAAKEEVSALWRGGWMPENISGVPAGRSVFHLTSPLQKLNPAADLWIKHCGHRPPLTGSRVGPPSCVRTEAVGCDTSVRNSLRLCRHIVYRTSTSATRVVLAD